VAELNREGKSISFEIFSPDAPVDVIRERVTIHPSISLNNTITDDELFFATLADADLLVLPVNFDRRSIRYIRYSMPTKVPAYLISGTPILVYGPTSVAQVDYALREGWGEVVSRHGVESLKDAIVMLWQNQERRLHLSLNARRVARRNHDSRIVRAGFQQALLRGASGISMMNSEPFFIEESRAVK
jgi:glycosyltransferase involved in cell wall biosynthesis